MKAFAKSSLLAFLLALGAFCRLHAAETLDQLVAGAKKEPEMTFIAGAQTFGGQKTLAQLQAAFNKKFGLTTRIQFAVERSPNHPRQGRFPLVAPGGGNPNGQVSA